MDSLLEYLKENDFRTGKGLPQGDTYVDLSACKVEEGSYEGRTTYSIIMPDGDTYFVPKSVLSEMKKRLSEGHTKVRITRVGQGLKDTRYTVVGIKEMPTTKNSKDEKNASNGGDACKVIDL